MSPETFDRRREYLRQALYYHPTPGAPEPNIGLLSGGEHGPFTTIKEGPDPDTGEPSVFWQTHGFKRRWTAPEAFLVIDLLLTFGGGMMTDSNGKGLGYPKLLLSGTNITIARILTGAGTGELAKQHNREGRRGDYHDLHPRRLFKKLLDAAKLSKPTYQGRPEAIAAALRIFDRNQPASGIDITRDDYARLLEEAFRLLDAVHGHYWARLEDNV